MYISSFENSTKPDIYSTENSVHSDHLLLQKLVFCSTFEFIISSNNRSGLGVIKLFSSSTQLSTKFILLINGILTFISMINTRSERLKASKLLVVGILVFMSSWNFRAQLSWAWNKFYILWPGLFEYQILAYHFIQHYKLILRGDWLWNNF